MSYQTRIGSEQNTISCIYGSGNDSLIDEKMLPVVRQTEIESQKIGNYKCHKHYGDIRSENHPPGHRVPVEEVECLSPKS